MAEPTAGEQAQLLADALALEHAIELLTWYHHPDRLGYVPSQQVAGMIWSAHFILGAAAYRLRNAAGTGEDIPASASWEMVTRYLADAPLLNDPDFLESLAQMRRGECRIARTRAEEKAEEKIEKGNGRKREEGEVGEVEEGDMKAGEVAIEKRIGDPTREKYVAFFARCYELGYITAEEREERTAIVLAARTMSDINAVIGDLDTDGWNKAWKDFRAQGLQPVNSVIQAVPAVPVPDQVTANTRALRNAIIMVVIAMTLFFASLALLIVEVAR